MGRVEYLNRLGLGLSAFRPIHDDPPPSTQNERHSGPGQRYNPRGRPTSTAADSLNAELRHAQNEVLELVDIVERRPAESLQSASQRTLSATRQVRLHRAVSRACSLLQMVATWYPETLLQRYLLGLQDPGMPFSQTLYQDCVTARRGGIMTAINTLLPGFSTFLVYSALGMATHGTINSAKWRYGQGRDLVTQSLLLLTDLTVQSCFLPALPYLTLERSGLIRAPTLASSAARLIGFYHLRNRRLLELDTAMTFVFVGIPMLLTTIRAYTSCHLPTQPALWRWALQLLWPTELVTPLGTMVLMDASSSGNIDVVNFSGASNAYDETHDDGTWNLLNTRTVLLLALGNASREALQIAVRCIALHCAIGVSHHIALGPGTSYTAVPILHDMPKVQQYLMLPLGRSIFGSYPTVASINLISKIGLALGLKILLDATVCGIRYALHTYVYLDKS